MQLGVGGCGGVWLGGVECGRVQLGVDGCSMVW